MTLRHFAVLLLNLKSRNSLNCHLSKIMADYPICAAVGKRRWRFSPPPSRKIVARKKVRLPLPLPPLFECRLETSTTYGAEVREAGPLEWAFPFRSNAGAKSVRPLHACPDCQVGRSDAAMSPAAAERDANGPSMMPTLHCGPLAYSADIFRVRLSVQCAQLAWNSTM